MRLTILLIVILTAASLVQGETSACGAFEFSFAVELPATPAVVWNSATGNVGDWWDHSMSDNPYKLVIEPWPGGQFREEFDASGNGVIHADITYAKQNKMLRMEGPLGLAGYAIHMVTTWTLVPGDTDNTTLMTVEVHAAGEVQDGWDAIVEKTWRHFIEDRLGNYLAGDPK